MSPFPKLAPAAVALALVLGGAAACSDGGSSSDATTTTAAATASTAGSSTASGTVSANDASTDEIAAALDAAGVDNAERWADEVAEYRPYDDADQGFPHLREELAKYDPPAGTIDQIIAVLGMSAVAVDAEAVVGRLRAGLLVLAGLGVAGTAAELAAIRHWESAVQLIPWAVLAALGAAIAAVAWLPGRATVLGSRLVGLATLAVGAYGVVEHVSSNLSSGPLDATYGPRWASMGTASRLVGRRLRRRRALAPAGPGDPRPDRPLPPARHAGPPGPDRDRHGLHPVVVASSTWPRS